MDRIEPLDCQIDELNHLAAQQMQVHRDTMMRLIEMPGISIEVAHEILAEIGPTTAAFPSGRQLAYHRLAVFNQRRSGKNFSCLTRRQSRVGFQVSVAVRSLIAPMRLPACRSPETPP